MPDIKPSELIHEEDLKDGEEPEEVKKKIRERKLANCTEFELAAEETVYDDVYRDEKSDEDAWDAETILSTYTNTDNHPGLIKTERRVRPSQRMKIELHKQFKVPVDGLLPLAEEITVYKEKKAAMDNNKPFSRVPAASGQGERPPASPRGEEDADEEVEQEEPEVDKKAQKKLVKAQQRAKRQMKKQLKQAFNSQIQTEVAKGVTEMGGIRQGISIKKIY